MTLACERLWVVDEFQPVAAVLDPTSGAVERLVSWTELPPPPVSFAPWYFGWRVFGTGDGVWVQPFRDGPVGLVGPGGLVHARPSEGLRLAEADTRGAWCIPQNSPRDLSPSRALLLIRPNGTMVHLRAQTPVRAVRTTPKGVCVRVDRPPAHRQDAVDTTERDQQAAWLHLPAHEAIPEQLTLAGHRSGPPASSGRRQLGGSRSVFLRPVHAPPRGHAPETPGLCWGAGWRREEPARQDVVATGHVPASGVEQCRFALGGPATVTALIGSGGFMWVALRRARWVSPYVSGPVELLRLDPASGQSEVVLPADSLGITEHCWPRPGKPVEADSYAQHQLQAFEGLRIAGADDVSAELTGAWPHTAIRVSCTHTRRPGLRLVRLVPLFDELGRLRPPEQARFHLTEDLDDNWGGAHTLPPASEAVDGILQV